MKTKKMLEKLTFKAVAVLIGIVVCIITFAFSSRSDLVNAEKHISSIINYIGNQCAAYNVTNLSSETESLMRIMESAQQVDRDIAYDRRITHRDVPEEKLLKQYTEELYLTGIVVLNSDGEVEAKYLSDELKALFGKGCRFRCCRVSAEKIRCPQCLAGWFFFRFVHGRPHRYERSHSRLLSHAK